MSTKKMYTRPTHVAIEVVVEGALFVGSDIVKGDTTNAGSGWGTGTQVTSSSLQSERSFDLTPSNDGSSDLFQ